MKYLFLDTNIYLHYIDFEQINWKDVIRDNDDYQIVVPQIVIREIDKIKDSGNGKIKTRAKKISSKFGAIFLEDKTFNVKIIGVADPSEHQFDGKKFNRLINDDWLILSALNFEANNSNKIVIAADNNLLIKAKDSNLEFRKIQDKYQLKDEISEEEKEIIVLRKELETHKNRRSKPNIIFEDGSSLLRLKRPAILDLEDEVQSKVKIEKENNPYIIDYKTNDYPGEAITNYLSLIKVLNTPTAEQARRYNKELDEYFIDFEKYIRSVTKCNIRESYMQKINFLLENKGNAPTGNMNIFITFPNDIRLYGNKNKFKEAIDEPVKPQNAVYGMPVEMQKALRNIQISQDIFGRRQSSDFRYCWDLSKPIKNQFKRSQNELNHHLTMPLDVGDSIFIDLSQCGNFSVEWFIVDSSVSEPATGKLNITIE